MSSFRVSQWVDTVALVELLELLHFFEPGLLLSLAGVELVPEMVNSQLVPEKGLLE